MLDIKYVLNNIEEVKKGLSNRNKLVVLDEVLGLNEQRKQLQREFDDLRSQQNQKSKEIALLKKEKKDAQSLIDEMQNVAAKVKEIGQKQTEIESCLNDKMLGIPNIPHETVPVGIDEHGNKVVREWGEIKKIDFAPKEHWQLGEELRQLDFERAARLAGARFAILRGNLARLERALVNFMLDVHSANGYEEILPPLLVNANALLGTGQLPKFEEDLFKTTLGYYLIPTAEVPVTNIYREEVLSAGDLPKKFCAYTPCFRSEAGAAGKDTRGLIRQHQFNKVELVHLSTPADSFTHLEELTKNAESILQKLELPYRTVALCTGDMGFSSAKTYDIEVWLPGQNAYREISSCSNCTDFQARRMNLRFKDSE